MLDLVAKLVKTLELCYDHCRLWHPDVETNNVGAEVQATLSAAKNGGWLPMEMAPKDGTPVFVYVPGDSLFPTAAVYKSADYFEKEYGDREYMEEGWYWAFGYPTDFHECVITPTAWRHIGPDPSED